MACVTFTRFDVLSAFEKRGLDIRHSQRKMQFVTHATMENDLLPPQQLSVVATDTTQRSSTASLWNSSRVSALSCRSAKLLTIFATRGERLPFIDGHLIGSRRGPNSQIAVQRRRRHCEQPSIFKLFKMPTHWMPAKQFFHGCNPIRIEKNGDGSE